MRIFLAPGGSFVFCLLGRRNQAGFQPGVGDRRVEVAHPREHQISGETMMFKIILSALTLVGYLVPQVIWCIRRGQ
jgi:hypothetical protein